MKLFLSYRRKDARAVTERVYDRLVAHFGKACVFKDVDSIAAGSDFRARLKTVLDECNAVIVVIGERWLEIKEKGEDRRLDDPADFVRIEIEVALSRKIPIIPLLVDPACMPSEQELPASLQALASRQALTIRSDPDFHSDVHHLIGILEKLRFSNPTQADAADQLDRPEDSQKLSPRPVKRQAVLDRRLATEIVVLFSRPELLAVVDPKLPRLLRICVALYDQLLVENRYGSTLFQIIRREPDIFEDLLYMVPSPQPPDVLDFLEMTNDAAHLVAVNPQFQLMVTQYDRKKGGTLGAVEENIAYLQSMLQLAQQFDAAIVPHPDRWPLLNWLFEHSLWITTDSAKAASVSLAVDWLDASLQLSPEREKRARRLDAILPSAADFSLRLVRYGPVPYPFPLEILRHYERNDLAATGPPFLYEFCVLDD